MRKQVSSLALQAEPPHTSYVDAGDVGYHHSLSNLQIQMIAIGGAIGVGLFLGVGERLRNAGPGLVFSYLVIGAIVYLMLRALGEMVLYRPTTGAFVSYAREFVSDRFAHLTGWIYVTLAALAGIVELAAIGIYVNYWLPGLDGWISSLAAILLIGGANLVSVKVFGAIELGAAAVKVAAIVAFLITGVIAVALAMSGSIDSPASIANLWHDGGLFPKGVWAAVIVMQGVVFSFSAVEIVGISAGEANDPQATMPRAIRSVIVRIGLFYIGSILVLSMLMHTRDYRGDQSPFVSALASLGIPALAGVMNFVVLTAALSGVNATLYATVRLLRNLAANGRAPAFTNTMSHRGVPVGALLTIGSVYLIGCVLIFFAGASTAFEIVLNAVAVFILFGWIAIFVSHLGYRRRVAAGLLPKPTFRMPGAPVTDWICLVALAALALSMMFDVNDPHWYYSPIGAAVLLGVHNLTYEYYRRVHPTPPKRAQEPIHG
jgi:L-asparagine permease